MRLFISFFIYGMAIANVSACRIIVSSYSGRKDSDIFLLSQENAEKDNDKCVSMQSGRVKTMIDSDGFATLYI